MWSTTMIWLPWNGFTVHLELRGVVVEEDLSSFNKTRAQAPGRFASRFWSSSRVRWRVIWLLSLERWCCLNSHVVFFAFGGIHRPISLKSGGKWQIKRLGVSGRAIQEQMLQNQWIKTNKNSTRLWIECGSIWGKKILLVQGKRKSTHPNTNPWETESVWYHLIWS